MPNNTQTDLFTGRGYTPPCSRHQRFAGVDVAGRVDAVQCQAADAASPPTPMVLRLLRTPAAEAMPSCRHRTQTSRSGRTLIYHRPDNRAPLLTWRL